MTESSPEDPLDWDVDRVCRELCFPGVEWTNDPLALESLLRFNLMDGETLLTYELEFSRTDLMVCLEIKAARYRSKLARKLRELQSRSRGFHKWKKSLAADEASYARDLAETLVIPHTTQQETSPQATLGSGSLVANTDHIQSNAIESTEPPKKRRRLEPTFVGSLSSTASAVRMPGFEEPKAKIDIKRYPVNEEDSNEDSATAYLGATAIKQPTILLEDGEDESDSGSDTFQSVATKPRPRGKTRAIYSMVKKNLLRSNKKPSQLTAGLSGNARSDDIDQIINFDDDVESLDEETLREMADEEAENQQASSSSLDSEVVESVINQEIARIKERWDKKKRPKYERRAFSLWMHAHKHGLLRKSAFEARKEGEFYRSRLAKLTRDISSLSWKTEDELRLQTRSIDQTVEDKIHREWLTNLFMRRTAPAKPPPAHSKPKAPHRKPLAHNEEVLSSSDEDDFIVDDEKNNSACDLLLSRQPSAGAIYTNIKSPVSPTKTPPPQTKTELSADSPTYSLIDLTHLSDDEMEQPQEQLVPNQFEPFSQDLLEEIGSINPKIWAKKKDRFRLAISLLWRLTFDRREKVFSLLAGSDVDIIWTQSLNKFIERYEADGESPATNAAFDLVLIYMSFLNGRYYKEQKIANIREKDVDKLKKSQESFPTFCAFLMSLKDAFPKEHQIARLDAYDEELLGPDETATPGSSRAKKSKRKEVVMDRSAVALREREFKRLEEQEKRRNELRTNMIDQGLNGMMANNTANLIINEAKEAKDGFIYVHGDIARKIKDHQLEGVRFMWNHIVRDPSERQGCLLAHTMGLGKTMQTITFLVALRESGLSHDAAVRNQIPQDLRKWNVLVLCPAGLVENWKDEFLIWAPKDLMGQIITIEAAHSTADRLANARQWNAEGGVLIIGYNMFKAEFQTGAPSVTIDKILVEGATIVIADEAHNLKNPVAKISKLTSLMKTNTRIALSGSPLANNVEEYYSMINWVAPNFLGPQQEFRDIYAKPIQQGLYHDSSAFEKRKAVKLLQVLKETAAPKVHRATIKSCLKDDLPPKQEFVISVPPTAMQRQLYDMYMTSSVTSNNNISQAGLFTVLSQLALICAHPAVYRKKIINIQSKSSIGRTIAQFPMETIPKVLKVTGQLDLDRTDFSYKVELLTVVLDQARELNDKVLVFSQSTLTLNYLESLFKKQYRKVCRLDGSTTISKRQGMVKQFNSGSDEVYLISTTAGGVGLNIHGANRVVIFDFKWNPVQEQQAIGRAYRIGQKKPVFVYRFVMAGTFEDDLQNKAVFKTQLASRVVDQKNYISWSKRDKKLIHPIRDVDATDDRFNFRGRDQILDDLLNHDKGRAILSIMSSETFEEEDETATLTAEERREAQNMVERERLRVKNPAEYSRLMESERQASRQRPCSLFATSKPDQDWFPERPQHAFQPRALGNLATVHGANTVSSASQGTTTTTTTTTVGPATLPITGANTYFGSSESTFASTNVLPTNGESWRSCDYSKRDSQAKFNMALIHALRAVLASSPRVKFSAEELAKSICARVEAVMKAEKKGFTFDRLRWELLTAKLGNTKLALAAASGQITTDFLATAEDGEIQHRLQIIESLPNEMLLHHIEAGGRPKDPESLSNNLTRSPTRWYNNNMKKKQADDDVQAIRRASEMRNKRVSLPSWANKVLSNNASGRGRLSENLFQGRSWW